jgi:hypothetical protein
LRRAVAARRSTGNRAERLRAAVVAAREASLTAIGVVDEAEAALAQAERREQRRAVAEALGEAIPPGPSREEARRALEQAHEKHGLARNGVATLESGSREVTANLQLANGAVRAAIAEVLTGEGAIDRLLMAYDEARVKVEQVAAVLRFLGPTYGVPLGWEHPQRPLPPHQTPAVAMWRAMLRELEDATVETAFPEIP